MGELTLRGRHFVWGSRTYVMGILNVTPDSFSGDGVLTTEGAAVALAQAQTRTFVADGVDIVDVGGESTRPGAVVMPADEERERVVPVIRALRSAFDVPLSVDTWKVEVAAAALDAGADIINDIWGLRLPGGGWNDDLGRLVADRRVPIILMHNRRGVVMRDGRGAHYEPVHYDDIMADIVRDLAESVARAQQLGIVREQIVVDPGIGFGKSPRQNILVLRRLGELRLLGLPVLLGTSRKSFIGLVLDVPAEERVEGTAATVALGIAAGVDIVRVHDVRALVRVARMTDAIVRLGANPLEQRMT